jgi:hypothetical protein
MASKSDRSDADSSTIPATHSSKNKSLASLAFYNKVDDDDKVRLPEWKSKIKSRGKAVIRIKSASDIKMKMGGMPVDEQIREMEKV